MAKKRKVSQVSENKGAEVTKAAGQDLLSHDREEPKQKQASPPAPASSNASATTSAYGSIGTLLRQRRQEQEKSLHDVAAAINIRVAQLQALEDENLSALPGMTYALGFLRSYADHLGLNGVEIVARFKEGHQQEVNEKPELNFPVPVSETLIPGPKIVWASLGVFALLLVLSALFYGAGSQDRARVISEPPQELMQGIDEAPSLPVEGAGDIVMDVPLADAPVQDIPSVEAAASLPPLTSPEIESPATEPEPVPVAAPPVTPAPVAAAPLPEEKKLTAPQKPQGRVVIKASHNSWVQVSDRTGKIVLRKVLRPGETYTVPAQPGLEMVTTNAGGLEILVDGKAIKSLGKPGAIIRGIDLDPEDLNKR